MSHFKHDIPKSNLHILEWVNEISIAGETYSEIVRQKFTLYSASSFPLFKDYMETRRSEWEEYKYFTAEQVRDMSLKNYNNLLISGRCFIKDPKYAQILTLVRVVQKLADDSNKSSEKSNTSNRETTKVELSYIRYLLPWMLEDPNVEWETKIRTENNTSGASNNALAKASGSTTSQKTTGSWPAPHQEAEEALSHQARETATRI